MHAPSPQPPDRFVTQSWYDATSVARN